MALPVEIHLVEILRRLAEHEHRLQERIDLLIAENDGVDDPEVDAQVEQLDDESNRPIGRLASRIEELTGIGWAEIEDLTRRLITGFGAQPHVRRGKPEANPDTLGLERPIINEFPDLRHLYPKLYQLDVHGTTAFLLRDLRAQFPDVCREMGLLAAETADPKVKPKKRKISGSRAAAQTADKARRRTASLSRSASADHHIAQPDSTDGIRAKAESISKYVRRVPAWPPDDGCHRRPGEFAFNGTTVLVSGKPWEVLDALAEASGPLTVNDLRLAISPEYPIEDTTIRTHVYKARRALRTGFRLPAGSNPIPAVDTGNRRAWKLDFAALNSKRVSKRKPAARGARRTRGRKRRINAKSTQNTRAGKR